MKVFGSADIDTMISSLKKNNENVKPFIGKGKNKKLVVKKGLKLEHEPTGFVYSIIDVGLLDGKIAFKCDGPDGITIIKSKNLKDYKVQ